MVLQCRSGATTTSSILQFKCVYINERYTYIELTIFATVIIFLSTYIATVNNKSYVGEKVCGLLDFSSCRENFCDFGLDYILRHAFAVKLVGKTFVVY